MEELAWEYLETSDMVVVVRDVAGTTKIQNLLAYVSRPSPTSTTMDALKAEIASKRKVLQDEPLLADRPTKYMRRGDIDRLRQEQQEQEKRKREEAAQKQAADATNNPKDSRVSLFHLGSSSVS